MVATLTFLVVCNTRILGQNAVPNSSFENGNDGNPDFINTGLNGLNIWRAFGSSDWIESGDWINGVNQGQFPNANSGNHYVGFGACEGAQVQLNYPTSADHYLAVPSFYYRPRFSNPSEINLFLLNEEFTGLLDCYSFDAFNVGYHINHEIPNPVTSAWTEYQSDQAFVIADENRPSHIAFRGAPELGAYGSTKYMLIDDVQLDIIDYCDSECGLYDDEITSFIGLLEEDGTITEFHTTDVIQGLFTPNVPDPGDPWILYINSGYNGIITLADAKWVELSVRDRWHNTTTRTWFDPTGLDDANYDASSLPDAYDHFPQRPEPNYFTVFWDGRMKGELAQEAVYTAKLRYSNCAYDPYPRDIEFLIVYGCPDDPDIENNCTNDVPYTDIPVYNSPRTILIDDCVTIPSSGRFCNPVLVEELTDFQIEHGTAFMGSEVTLSLNSDWLLQSANSLRGSKYVEIIASADITPSTESPGSLSISLVKADCPEEAKTEIVSDSPYHFTRDREIAAITSAQAKPVFEVFPNPVSQGEPFHIKFDRELEKVDFIDLRGTRVASVLINQSNTISDGIYEMSLSVKSGTYIIKGVAHEEVVYSRIVVQ